MIGIDEVGRGAWAGPLVVTGCYFIENPGFVRGLDDSKKLSKKQRELLAPQIMSSTMFHIVSITPEFIDEHGLTESIKTAILEIVQKMPTDMVIQLDGKYNFLKDTEYEDRVRVEVGADGKHVDVMAASILAKVERDQAMAEYAKIYPEYGFDKNVGYGTKEHIIALRKYGPTPIHRKSFKPIKMLDSSH